MVITASGSQPAKVLAQLRGALRRHQLSPRTEQAYVSWVRRYVRFHRLRHPGKMGQGQVIAFLTLAGAERDASRSTADDPAGVDGRHCKNTWKAVP
jgi:hypothetical protein